jgi:hypothetical protein
MQPSIPPRSARRAVGGVWSFEIAPPPDIFGRLLTLLSSVRDERTLRLPLARTGGVAGTSAGAVAVAGTGESARVSMGSSMGGVGGALRFILPRRWVDQRPCICLLSTFEPCLLSCKYAQYTTAIPTHRAFHDQGKPSANHDELETERKYFCLALFS